MKKHEVTKWLIVMKASLNSFPEVSKAKKIEALEEAIRFLKNEQSINKIDCDYTECRNCINHKYCDYEPSSSEKPNKSEIPTGSDDCISRADALRVAKNEYLRGWHNALCKALSEKYSIHCEEGNFSVIQEETITGLGLSMNCAVGKDVESYMSTIPSVTPIRPKGHWREVDTNMYACSKCSHVLTIDPLDNSILGMNTCPFCSAEMEGVVDDKGRSKTLVRNRTENVGR